MVLEKTSVCKSMRLRVRSIVSGENKKEVNGLKYSFLLKKSKLIKILFVLSLTSTEIRESTQEKPRKWENSGILGMYDDRKES